MEREGRKRKRKKKSGEMKSDFGNTSQQNVPAPSVGFLWNTREWRVETVYVVVFLAGVTQSH